LHGAKVKKNLLPWLGVLTNDFAGCMPSSTTTPMLSMSQNLVIFFRCAGVFPARKTIDFLIQVLS